VRIGYVGGFRTSWHTETHVADALEVLGHDVERIEHSGTSWAELISRASKRDFDLLMLSPRPVRGTTRGSVEALDKVRAEYVPIVSYHLDIYTGLSRMLDVGLDPWWKADFVFTADGGTDARYWERKGIRHRWLCAAIPADEVYRGEVDDRFACDVAFVGGVRNYLPEWQYRTDVVNFLQRRYGSSFRIFPTSQGALARRIHGDDLNRLYATAKVIVGDSYCPGFTHPRYWSDRIYQTLGRGGVLVHPMIEGIETQYDPGLDFETYTFGDYIELGQKIDALLDDPDRGRAMSRRAMEQTIERHTYALRMAELMNVVEREFFR
jgi:hypothetical protein